MLLALIVLNLAFVMPLTAIYLVSKIVDDFADHRRLMAWVGIIGLIGLIGMGATVVLVFGDGLLRSTDL